MSNFRIDINQPSLGGLAPGFWKETYPATGNKNMAGSMLHMDLTNPGFITQGPGLSTLTAGTQAGAVTSNIRGILDYAVTNNVCYGVGGNKLQQFSATAVTNAGAWPHTIDKAAVTSETGEDVAVYQGALYYSYNHSGNAGDIGKYDLSSSFDDDWGSTVPSGAAALQNPAAANYTPHQMVVGGNDVLYIANGRYVATYDGTTFVPQALDFPSDAIVMSIAWMSDRLWIAVQRPQLVVGNNLQSSIYVWDGTTDSWESEIKVTGAVTSLFVKNNVLYLWHYSNPASVIVRFGYVSGLQIIDLVTFQNPAPLYFNVSEYKDFIIWNVNGGTESKVFAYGVGDKGLNTRFFQYTSGGYIDAGGIAVPFSVPMISSFDSSGGTNIKFAKFSGYATGGNWKSLMFDVTGEDKNGSHVVVVKIRWDTLASGARVDWKLLNSEGRTVYSDTISFSKFGTNTSAIYKLNGKVTDDLRVEFDYTNGSATNPVSIKSVKVYGTN